MADTLLHCPASAAMTISSDERQFFVTMGERIASMRKARNLTQTQAREAVHSAQAQCRSQQRGTHALFLALFF